jgi:hypothetical protein
MTSKNLLPLLGAAVLCVSTTPANSQQKSMAEGTARLIPGQI